MELSDERIGELAKEVSDEGEDEFKAM